MEVKITNFIYLDILLPKKHKISIMDDRFFLVGLDKQFILKVSH